MGIYRNLLQQKRIKKERKNFKRSKNANGEIKLARKKKNKNK